MTLTSPVHSILLPGRAASSLAAARLPHARDATGKPFVLPVSTRRAEDCPPYPAFRSAFTLLELLVVIAIVALLAAILLPVSLRAVEDARAARAMTELRSVEAALEAYRADHKTYPPCSISCQSSDAEEELQLPRELADGGYLPPSPGRSSSLLQDPFHPGSTYKYVASLPYWLNGQHMPDDYPVWIPDDFPLCRASSGSWKSGTDCPLDWAVWSIGPRYSTIPFSTSDRLPLDSAGWRTRPGRPGIIARIKPRDGASFSVP